MKNILEKWLETEVRDAPDIYPRPDVYAVLQRAGRTRSRFFSSRTLRWLAVASAGAFLIVLIVIGPDIFRPISSDTSIQTANIPELGMRAGQISEQRVAPMAAPRENSFRAREEKSMPAAERPKGIRKQGPLRQLLLEIQKNGSDFPVVVDLLAPEPVIPALTSRDNFRMTVRSTGQQFISVFLSFSGGKIYRLFPNGTYASLQNPVAAEQALLLPAPPNWLYLENPASCILYVALSDSSTERWDDLYEEIFQTSRPKKSGRLSAELEAQLKKSAEKTDDKTLVMFFPLIFRQE